MDGRNDGDDTRTSLLAESVEIRYVYVAGPYTNGYPPENVRRAYAVAERLVAMGFEPYIPHASMLWDIYSPHEYEYWMARDMAWLEQCDAIVRMPGVSPGADRECAWAVKNDIPVYFIDDNGVMYA